MMAIRIACFVLMVLITPYGWYTWVFAAGAVFLPYVAVVLANAGEDVRRPEVENPERALPAATAMSAPVMVDPGAPVIRIQESRPVRPFDAPKDPDAESDQR